MFNSTVLNTYCLNIEGKFVEYARANGSKEPWRYAGPRGHIRKAIFKALKFDWGEGKVRLLYPDWALNDNERFLFFTAHSVFCHTLELTTEAGVPYKEAFQLAKEDMKDTADILTEVSNRNMERERYGSLGKAETAI